MNFKYRVGRPLNGFTSIVKVIRRFRAERTVNWFLTGIKEAQWNAEIGSVNAFRFISIDKGAD